MLRILSIVPFCFLLAACASTSDGIIKCGKGTYAVDGAPDSPFGNYLKSARNDALEQAKTFCQSKRKQVLVLDIVEGLPTHATFRCVAKDDPELQQSAYANEPALIDKNPCQ